MQDVILMDDDWSSISDEPLDLSSDDETGPALVTLRPPGAMAAVHQSAAAAKLVAAAARIAEIEAAAENGVREQAAEAESERRLAEQEVERRRAARHRALVDRAPKRDEKAPSADPFSAEAGRALSSAELLAAARSQLAAELARQQGHRTPTPPSTLPPPRTGPPQRPLPRAARREGARPLSARAPLSARSPDVVTIPRVHPAAAAAPPRAATARVDGAPAAAPARLPRVRAATAAFVSDAMKVSLLCTVTFYAILLTV